MCLKQIRPNLTKGYSQTYICAYYIRTKEEKYMILYFEAAKDMLVLNKSSLGRGTKRLFLELVLWDWWLTKSCAR